MKTKEEHIAEFMKTFRGIPAYTVAEAVSKLTPGIDWRKCSKGHIAKEYANAMDGEYLYPYPAMKNLNLVEAKRKADEILKKRGRA